MTLGQWLLQYLLGYLCIGWGVVSAVLVMNPHSPVCRTKDWLSVFLAWLLWPIFLWFLARESNPRRSGGE